MVLGECHRGGGHSRCSLFLRARVFSPPGGLEASAHSRQHHDVRRTRSFSPPGPPPGGGHADVGCWAGRYRSSLAVVAMSIAHRSIIVALFAWNLGFTALQWAAEMLSLMLMGGRCSRAHDFRHCCADNWAVV